MISFRKYADSSTSMQSIAALFSLSATNPRHLPLSPAKRENETNALSFHSPAIWQRKTEEPQPQFNFHPRWRLNSPAPDLDRSIRYATTGAISAICAGGENELLTDEHTHATKSDTEQSNDERRESSTQLPGKGRSADWKAEKYLGHPSNGRTPLPLS